MKYSFLTLIFFISISKVAFSNTCNKEFFNRTECAKPSKCEMYIGDPKVNIKGVVEITKADDEKCKIENSSNASGSSLGKQTCLIPKEKLSDYLGALWVTTEAQMNLTKLNFEDPNYKKTMEQYADKMKEANAKGASFMQYCKNDQKSVEIAEKMRETTIALNEFATSILGDTHPLSTLDLSKGVCVGILNHNKKSIVNWKIKEGADKETCLKETNKPCDELANEFGRDFFNLECNSLYEVFWIQSYHKYSPNDNETNLSPKTRLGSKNCLKNSFDSNVLNKCDLNFLWSKEVLTNNDTQIFVKAASFGYLPIVEALIKKKHNVNTPNKDGVTAIAAAVTQCRSNVVTYLLEHGVKKNQKDHHGRTLLMKASLCHDSSIVDSILKTNPELNLKDHHGETALMIAAESNHEEAVKLLLKAGADKSIQTKKKATALSKAKKAGFSKIVQLLSDGGNL